MKYYLKDLKIKLKKQYVMRYCFTQCKNKYNFWIKCKNPRIINILQNQCDYSNCSFSKAKKILFKCTKKHLNKILNNKFNKFRKVYIKFNKKRNKHEKWKKSQKKSKIIPNPGISFKINKKKYTRKKKMYIRKKTKLFNDFSLKVVTIAPASVLAI